MTVNLPTFESFVQITAYYHCQLDELIICHQECLLEQNLTLAQETFKYFDQAMRLHIQFENEVLLPNWQLISEPSSGAKGAAEKPKWPFIIYQKEHDKLLAMLAKADAFLSICCQPYESRQQYRRHILNSLEYLKTLKNVAEHHEQREEQGLLPELLGKATEEQKARILEQALSVWKPLMQEIDQLLEKVHQALA